MAELCKCWKLKICYDQDYNDIGVVIATKWRHNVLYLQLYFSALEIVLPKSFTGAFSSTFSSNNCYDRCPLSLSKICECVSEIFWSFWDGDFMVRNTIITWQSWCSAVIYRKRSAFQMRFHLMVVSVIFKTCLIIGIALADCLKGWRIWLVSIEALLSAIL